MLKLVKARPQKPFKVRYECKKFRKGWRIIIYIDGKGQMWDIATYTEAKARYLVCSLNDKAKELGEYEAGN